MSKRVSKYELTIGKESIPLLFDRVDISFNLNRFLWAMLLHLPFPLFIMFSKPCHGFRTLKPRSLFYNWFPPFALYLMIIAYCLSSDDLQYAIYIPAFLYLCHRLMVCLKYSTLSNSEYERLTSCDGEELAKYQDQAHLLTGWNRLNNAVIAFEVSAAAARCGIKLEKLRFYLPHGKDSFTYELWERLVEYAQSNIKMDEAKKANYVNVRDVCFALPHIAFRKLKDAGFFGYTAAFNFLYCTIIALLPFTLFLRGPKIESAWTGVFLVLSTFFCAVFGNLLSNFLGLSILSLYRNVEIANGLKTMIELSSTYLGENIRMCSGANNTELRQKMKSTRNNSVISMVVGICTNSNVNLDGDTPVVNDSKEAETVDKDDKDSDDEEGVHEFDWLRDVCEVNVNAHGDQKLIPKVENDDKGGDDGSWLCCKKQEVEAVSSEEVDFFENPENEEELSCPKVSLHCPTNVFAWLYSRSIMKNFGYRFDFRISIYVASTAIALFAIMIFIIIILSQSQTPGVVLGYVITLQALSTVVFIAIYIASFILVGSFANDEYDEHRRLIMFLLVQCRKGVSDLEVKLRATPDRLKDVVSKEILIMREICEALEACKLEIETTNEMEPVKVFGFPAESQLAVSVLTTTASFFGYIFTMVGQDTPSVP